MNWNEIFKEISKKEYSKKLNTFLNKEYEEKTIFPPREKIFNAFKLTNFEDVKVVIIGQDPYHEKGQAMGLAFSVPTSIELPPSLRNIYKEIGNEYNVNVSDCSGDLTYLAKQGVLLLNPILTVEEHKPLSHKIKEYDEFFKDIISALNNSNQVIIFMLWGSNAKAYKPLITNKLKYVIETNHPSPLSANRGGWFNQNQFKKCNEIKKSQFKRNKLDTNFKK